MKKNNAHCKCVSKTQLMMLKAQTGNKQTLLNTIDFLLDWQLMKPFGAFFPIGGGDGDDGGTVNDNANNNDNQLTLEVDDSRAFVYMTWAR